MEIKITLQASIFRTTYVIPTL